MKKVILCVDDENVVLSALSSQLRMTFKDTFIIETATGPEEAWEIIEELKEENTNIHLIISDWLMPVIKGDEFLVMVKEKLPDTKMIMLSGQADESAKLRVKKMPNFLAFIDKPWDKEFLINLILKTIKDE